MRRRGFIALVGSAVTAWPFTALGKAQRIAIVASFPASKMTETSDDPFFQALFNELRRLGYIEGNNLLIERYSGEGRVAYYRDLAREVAARNPDLVIAMGDYLVADFKAGAWSYRARRTARGRRRGSNSPNSLLHLLRSPTGTFQT